MTQFAFGVHVLYVLQKVQDQDILEFGKQDTELELFPSLQCSLNVSALRFIFPNLVYTAYINKLSNVKEEVYGAPDSFMEWDLEFPLITVKRH
nr:pentatricopeptide repeat-containing protein [Quercus suber]